MLYMSSLWFKFFSNHPPWEEDYPKKTKKKIEWSIPSIIRWCGSGFSRVYLRNERKANYLFLFFWFFMGDLLDMLHSKRLLCDQWIQSCKIWHFLRFFIYLQFNSMSPKRKLPRLWILATIHAPIWEDPFILVFRTGSYYCEIDLTGCFRCMTAECIVSSDFCMSLKKDFWRWEECHVYFLDDSFLERNIFTQNYLLLRWSFFLFFRRKCIFLLSWSEYMDLVSNRREIPTCIDHTKPDLMISERECMCSWIPRIARNILHIIHPEKLKLWTFGIIGSFCSEIDTTGQHVTVEFTIIDLFIVIFRQLIEFEDDDRRIHIKDWDTLSRWWDWSSDKLDSIEFLDEISCMCFLSQYECDTSIWAKIEGSWIAGREEESPSGNIAKIVSRQESSSKYGIKSEVDSTVDIRSIAKKYRSRKSCIRRGLKGRNDFWKEKNSRVRNISCLGNTHSSCTRIVQSNSWNILIVREWTREEKIRRCLTIGRGKSHIPKRLQPQITRGSIRDMENIFLEILFDDPQDQVSSREYCTLNIPCRCIDFGRCESSWSRKYSESIHIYRPW